MIVIVLDGAIEDIRHRLDATMWVPVEYAFREPVLHQEKERIGCDPITRGHKGPHAMRVGHSACDGGPVDPRDVATAAHGGHSVLLKDDRGVTQRRSPSCLAARASAPSHRDED